MKVLTAALLTAVVTFLTATAAGADTRVVGDSLTHQTYNESAGWQVDAAQGRALRSSRARVDAAAALDPDTLVVALGSNDVAKRSGSLEADIRHAAGVAPCVVLTTVKITGVNPFYNRRWAEWARRWNRAVWASGAHVADWNRIARDHPRYFLADGLHLTRAGEVAYDAMLRRSAAFCQPSD
jgi:hypothetical protein